MYPGYYIEKSLVPKLIPSFLTYMQHQYIIWNEVRYPDKIRRIKSTES